jgi:hypothetical protein
MAEEEALPHQDRRGPWVQTALFCEKVLEDKEGVLSLIRVVDRVNRFAMGPASTGQMEPFDYQLMLVIALKPGEATGSATLEIGMQSPDGLTHPGPQVSVLFEGPDRGVAAVLPTQFRFDQVGLYWFNVRCDGDLLSRIPLRVVYQRSSTPMIPQGS